MTNTTDRTDAAIKTDVLAELNYEPSLKAANFGVLVLNGTVTLNGFATTYAEKLNVVKAARRVAGVRAIADDIEIKYPASLRRTDGDIAAACADNISSLAWAVPGKDVQVTVAEGLVTLEGKVEHWYQKEAAKNVVCALPGVQGVFNAITIKPRAIEANVDASIRAAYLRSALLAAGKIEVSAIGSTITISGEVRNNGQREEAERLAWAAPGVNAVNNCLTLAC